MEKKWLDVVFLHFHDFWSKLRLAYDRRLGNSDFFEETYADILY